MRLVSGLPTTSPQEFLFMAVHDKAAGFLQNKWSERERAQQNESHSVFLNNLICEGKYHFCLSLLVTQTNLCIIQEGTIKVQNISWRGSFALLWSLTCIYLFLYIHTEKWFTKPKVFTVWPFTENLCMYLIQEIGDYCVDLGSSCARGTVVAMYCMQHISTVQEFRSSDVKIIHIFSGEIGNSDFCMKLPKV